MNAVAIPQAGKIDTGLFASSQPPAVERLSRIEGQSNFLSILAGIEAGADTTEDMGALSFARARGCVPETLEAWVAQSVLFKLPLMSIVYRAVVTEMKPADKDLPWVRGAIADAFLLLSRGECKPLNVRAKSFKTDISAYSAMRKVAQGVFAGMVDRAETEFRRARKSEIPGKVHTKLSGDHYQRTQLTTTASICTKDASTRECSTGWEHDPETLYPAFGPDSLWHPERA